MHKKTPIILGLLMVIALPAALMLLVHHRLAPSLLKPGETLPSVHLTLEQGQDTVANQQRRVVILYKPSCTHCRRTIRDLARLYQDHSNWFAAKTGISVDLVDISGTQEYLPEEAHLPFNIYADRHGAATAAFKGSLVPYVLFVDEKDVVRYSHTGELSFDQEQNLIQNFYQTGNTL